MTTKELEELIKKQADYLPNPNDFVKENRRYLYRTIHIINDIRPIINKEVFPQRTKKNDIEFEFEIVKTTNGFAWKFKRIVE